MIYIYIYIVRDNEQRVTNDDSFLSHGIQIAAIIVVENRKTNQEIANCYIQTGLSGKL